MSKTTSTAKEILNSIYKLHNQENAQQESL